MLIVKPGPMPNPAAVQNITSAMWGTSQYHMVRLSLWSFSWGDGKLLTGVSSTSRAAEWQAAQTISLGTPLGQEEIEPADDMLRSILARTDSCCRTLKPVPRDISVTKDPSWWRQSNDPLYNVHTMIERTPKNHVAGTIFTFRALVNGASRASSTVFAVGEDARWLSQNIVVQYQELGTTSVFPLLQRRALERSIAGELRRPVFPVSQGDLEIYWHPPFLQDPRRQGVAGMAI